MAGVKVKIPFEIHPDAYEMLVAIAERYELPDPSTSIRDYVRTDGEPGGYQVRLLAYDRAGKACVRCRTTLCGRTIGQRSTVWCPRCQR